MHVLQRDLEGDRYTGKYLIRQCGGVFLRILSAFRNVYFPVQDCIKETAK